MAGDKKRKWLAGISLAVVLLLAVLITVLVWQWLASFSEEGFREYIRSFGGWSWAVMLGLQFLQVFVALIPGELPETASGYIFGPWGGTLICYLGIAAASTLIFWLTRRFGMRWVEPFFSHEKLKKLRFIQNEKKRDALIFLLFFIPGTPKDLLTYFVGLTEMKLPAFLILSLIARFPSVVSSTFGGHLLGEGNYWGALVLYCVVGIVSLGGFLLYNAILRRKNEKKE